MSQTNPAFADFRPNYWELYEKCRFNGLAPREQAAQAAKLEKRVRFALMISIVGSVSCGAVQTLTGIETAPVGTAQYFCDGAGRLGVFRQLLGKELRSLPCRPAI